MMPINRPLTIIGVMSGTSGDGIDVALCRVSGIPPQLDAQILHAQTFPYPDAFRQRIFASCDPHTSSVDEIARLHVDLAEIIAEKIRIVISEKGEQPDLIASHGQTIWHDVVDGRVQASLQIGSGAVIAERTAITTITNFRQRDISAGGQGAPLTAYADWLLLRHPEHWRAVQNIGGMANVTLLPPLNDDQSQPLAFDTGAGNALIDAAVYQLTEGQHAHDPDGSFARSGKIDHQWLAELLQHPYYAQKPPNTTGRELFGTAYARQLIQQAHTRQLSASTIIATVTALTAATIADAYERFAPHQPQEIIIGGGGVHNTYLMELIQRYTEIPTYPHEMVNINSDFKEALVFALLAHETWYHRPASLSPFTGSTHPTLLGDITPANNWQQLMQSTWRL